MNGVLLSFDVVAMVWYTTGVVSHAIEVFGVANFVFRSSRVVFEMLDEFGNTRGCFPFFRSSRIIIRFVSVLDLWLSSICNNLFLQGRYGPCKTVS